MSSIIHAFTNGCHSKHCGGTRGIPSQLFSDFTPFTGTTVQQECVSICLKHPRVTNIKPNDLQFGHLLVKILMIYCTFLQQNKMIQISQKVKVFIVLRFRNVKIYLFKKLKIELHRYMFMV